MGQESNHYEEIRKILAESLASSLTKEEIKAKIGGAIGEVDYIAAVTAYLWGAYNNFDSNAKVAFQEVFSEDLRLHNPSAYYFFSFYFLHDFKRTGFDRRKDKDRRNSYSLDFFCERIIERRRGPDRRKDPEKRTNWTRVSKWVSVPFNVDGGTQRANPPATAESPQIDGGTNNPRFGMGMDIQSLNSILSFLIAYHDIYIKQGQADWLNNVNDEIFMRAKQVMRDLLDR